MPYVFQSQAIIEEVMAETEAGTRCRTEAWTMEKGCFLPSSTAYAACLLTEPSTVGPQWLHPRRAGSSYTNDSLIKRTLHRPSEGGSSSTELPSSSVTPVCVTLTKTSEHSHGNAQHSLKCFGMSERTAFKNLIIPILQKK